MVVIIITTTTGVKEPLTVISEIFKAFDKDLKIRHVFSNSETLQREKTRSHLQFTTINVFITALYTLQKVTLSEFCQIFSYRLDFSSTGIVTKSSYRPVRG